VAESTARNSDNASRVRKWAWFAAWAGFGCLASLAATSFFLALAPLLATAAIAVTPPAIRRNAFGILVGAAYIPLWVAWLNRQGPGIVRWHAVNSGGWQTESDPKPWLLAGLTMIAVAVAGQILIHRRLRRHGAEPVRPR
jgi:hypothetical protein